jgi:hypothetical protein
MSYKSHKVLAVMIVSRLAARMPNILLKDPAIILKLSKLTKFISNYFATLDKKDKTEAFPTPSTVLTILQMIEVQWTDFNLDIDKSIRVKKTYTYRCSFNKSIIRIRKNIDLLQTMVKDPQYNQFVDFTVPPVSTPKVSDYLIANIDCLAV